MDEGDLEKAPDDLQKEVLHRYLRRTRDALLWKLNGLSDYDVRRPMTGTGSNLLGIVKHVATVAAGYFGEVFGRPFPEPLPWTDDDAEPNADMWATAEQSRSNILALSERAWAHADATIEALPLDATGEVPWWGPDRRVTLQRVLVHMLEETARHTGQADILREQIDGAVGVRADNDNMPEGVDKAWWAEYCERLERVAREVGGCPA
jgi:uncharacterized damage-inducible protein DinB